MLSNKQRLAIFLHIGGYSNTEISAQIGVHPTTVRTWMRNSEFSNELRAETDHAMARSRAQTQCAARRVADNACAAARATQSILLSDRTDPRLVVQCSKVMFQALVGLSKFLQEPAVVPLLESADPSKTSEQEEPEELNAIEQAQINMVRRTLEQKTADEQPCGTVGGVAEETPAPTAQGA